MVAASPAPMRHHCQRGRSAAAWSSPKACWMTGSLRIHANVPRSRVKAMLALVPLTERDLESLDPLRLDREIARVARAVHRWRRRLRSGGGLDDDPFIGGRIIASRTAFRAV